MMRGEINGNERTEPGLDIREKEGEPIKPAYARERRDALRSLQRLPRCRRRRKGADAAAGERTAVKLQCNRRQFILSGAAGELRRRVSAECPVHRPPLTLRSRAPRPTRYGWKLNLCPRKLNRPKDGSFEKYAQVPCFCELELCSNCKPAASSRSQARAVSGRLPSEFLAQD